MGVVPKYDGLFYVALFAKMDFLRAFYGLVTRIYDVPALHTCPIQISVHGRFDVD